MREKPKRTADDLLWINEKALKDESELKIMKSSKSWRIIALYGDFMIFMHKIGEAVRGKRG